MSGDRDQVGAGRGPLTGLRVVDATGGTAGPLATMLLADLGADVVVVADDPTGPTAPPGLAVWRRGTRRSTWDGAGFGAGFDAGAAPVVDVVVTDGPLLEGLALADRTIHLELPAYLPAAPWPHDTGSEALIESLLGAAVRQHSDEPGPVDSVVPVIPVVHGVWAAAVAVAALVERERSGRGQHVVVSGAQAGMVAFCAGLEIDTTAPPTASTGGDGGGRVPFYRTYRCGDGRWLFLASLTPRFSEIAFEVLGVTAMYDDPRLGGRGRAAMIEPENLGWVTDTVAAAFATASRDEWLERLHDAGCPAGPVLDRDRWLDHPQLDAIGMRVEVDDPVRGRVVMPGVPMELARTPGHVRGPAPDATSAAPVEWHDAPWALPEPIAASTADGAGGAAGPLDGVRVLDLGAIIAGPYAGSLLAELGADVVKVEPPTGDSFRGPGFGAYNKGQRSLAIDLRRAEGRDVVLRLARSADVVIDNYRPGVLRRLGLDVDDLAAVNPAIVSLSVTGFGDHGPLGSEAGFDPVLQAMSGMMASQGGDGPPVFFSIPINDVTTAATAALGSVVGVLHARRGGGGQKVTTSLAASSALVQAAELVRFDGRPPAGWGGRDHRGPSALDRLYAAADGWVRLLGGGSDDEANGDGDVERLATAGLPADVDALERWIGQRSRDEALAAVLGAGVRAVPVREPADLVADADLIAHGVIRPDPRTGREGRWTAGRFADLERTPVPPTALAPQIGEHSLALLHEAGLTDDEAERLVAEGVVVAAD